MKRETADRSGLLAVARATAGYSTLQLFLLVAGLISMPLTTRLLSKTEYGLLSLVFATLAVLTTLASAGLGNAGVRFFHETRLQGQVALRRLYEEILTGVLSGALPLAALTWAATYLVVEGWSIEFRTTLRHAVGLIAIRALSTVVQQMLRAEERVAVYARVQVATRYGTLILAVAMLYSGPRLAQTVLVAATVVEGLVLAWLFLELWRRQLIARPRWSRRIVRALSYGVPLAVAGSARVLLDYGNRFVVEHTLGLEALAAYVVPADLLARIVEMIVLPMQLAAAPVLFRLSATEGAGATSRTASQVLTYTIVCLVPVCALYARFGEELIVVVASEKYRGVGELTPWLLPAGVLAGLQFLVIAGSTLGNRTMRVGLWVCAAALVNLGLNALLVPRWGLPGAASATGLTYVGLTVAQAVESSSFVRLRLSLRPLACSMLATTIVIAPTMFGAWPTASAPLSLLATVGCLGLLALVLHACFDSDLRAVVKDWRHANARLDIAENRPES